jgi:hypothetical protein
MAETSDAPEQIMLKDSGCAPGLEGVAGSVASDPAYPVGHAANRVLEISDARNDRNRAHESALQS